MAQHGATVSRELIRLEDITKTYQLGEVDVPVLKGISLTIARGEMVALMGASGSGKTTLMNILGCLDRPSSGRFWFDGQEMSRLSPNERALVRTTRLGFVFQSFNLLPRTSALHNVLMPLDYALRRLARGDAHGRAESLLTQVGLATHLDHEPSQMSGGQQQRVAIARALVNRPALLLADEPTGNLDSRTGDEILRMFQRLNAQGITVILVTHDAKVAAYAHRTIHIADGLIADDPRRSSEGDSHATAAVPATLLEPPFAGGPLGNGSPHQHFDAGHVGSGHGADGHDGNGATLAAANEAPSSWLVAHAPRGVRRRAPGVSLGTINSLPPRRFRQAQGKSRKRTGRKRKQFLPRPGGTPLPALCSSPRCARPWAICERTSCDRPSRPWA